MNKLAFVCLFCGFSFLGFSQTEPSLKEKKSTYGFNIGLNYSNLIAPDGLPNSGSISNKVGFRLGILADYKLNRFMSFSPKAEVSFYNSSVTFPETSPLETYEVMPIDVEFMTHFVFKKNDTKAHPYFLVGPNLRMPVAKSRENSTDFGTGWDVAFDLGIGFDKAFSHFIFSPELRYSYGLLNVNKNPALQTLQLHNVALVFNFRG